MIGDHILYGGYKQNRPFHTFKDKSKEAVLGLASSKAIQNLLSSHRLELGSRNTGRGLAGDVINGS